MNSHEADRRGLLATGLFVGFLLSGAAAWILGAVAIPALFIAGIIAGVTMIYCAFVAVSGK